MKEKSQKLTEYTFAVEKIEDAEFVLNFLRNLLGTYSCEQNATYKIVEGYRMAMKDIINQAET